MALNINNIGNGFNFLTPELNFEGSLVTMNNRDQMIHLSNGKQSIELIVKRNTPIKHRFRLLVNRYFSVIEVKDRRKFQRIIKTFNTSDNNKRKKTYKALFNHIKDMEEKVLKSTLVKQEADLEKIIKVDSVKQLNWSFDESLTPQDNLFTFKKLMISNQLVKANKLVSRLQDHVQKVSVLSSKSKGQVLNNNEIKEVVQLKFDQIYSELDNCRLESFHVLIKDLTQAISKYKGKCENSIRNIKNVFQQIVIIEDLTLNEFINLMAGDSIGKIFNYYTILSSVGFEGIDLRKHVEIFEQGFVSDYPDWINYDEKDNSILVIYKGQYIYFQFKKENWNSHKLATPGFDILSKYHKQFKLGDMQNVTAVELLQSETNFSFGIEFEDYYKGKLKQVSDYYGLTVPEYENMLLSMNPNVYKLQNGILTMPNELNPNVVKQTVNIHKLDDSEEQLKHGLRFKQCYAPVKNIKDVPGHIQTTRDYFVNLPYGNDWVFPKENHALLSFVYLGSNQLEDFEEKLTDLILQCQLPSCILELYLCLTYPDKSQYIYDDRQITLYHPMVVFSEGKEAHLINRDLGVQHEPKYFYAWNTQAKDTIINGIEIKGKMNYKLMNKHKPMCIEILNKLKTSSISTEEIKFVSLFYGFINKVSYKVSRVKVRELIESIMPMKIGLQRENLVEILILRFGDLSSIVCGIILYLNQTLLSAEACQVICELQWFRIKTINWISYFKQFSEQVKNTRNILGVPLAFEDFKKLQYLEMLIGQMGSDGKSANDVIKQRSYPQMDKMLIKLDNIGFNTSKGQALATDLCERVLRNYWRMVFSKFNRDKRNNSQLPSLLKVIENRKKFATNSSTGGGNSNFNDKEFYKKYNVDLSKFGLKDFGQGTKSGVFDSEKDEFFVRVLFDLPLTICNMVLKPKEFAKQRYIYGVWLPHYLMNSLCTLPFEPYLDQLGVNYNLDPIDSIKTSLETKKLLYNCIDYSDFNDQHSESHKQLVFDSYIKEMMSMKWDNKDEYIVVATWMSISTNNMLIRTSTDDTVISKVSGRLFSGERSTTLINSLMSIFYHVLITVNMMLVRLSYQYAQNDIWFNLEKTVYESSEVIKLKYLLSDTSSELPEWLLTLIYDNKSLGDDSICKVKSVKYAHTYNEIALLSGLLLKVSKCLVGLGMSEYLRNIQLYHKEKKYVQKGYLVRSIATLVCGNLEGETDRYFSNEIIETHSLLNVIYNRSGVVGMLNDLAISIFNKLSRLNQAAKNKLKRVKLDYRWMYVPKLYNGLGLMEIGTNKVYIPKSKLIEIKRESSYELFKRSKLYATENALNEDLKIMLKYGEVNPRGIDRYLMKEFRQHVESHSAFKLLYSEKFLSYYPIICGKINNQLIDGNFIEHSKTCNLDVNEIEKCHKFISENFNVKTLKSTSVVGVTKKLEMIEQQIRWILPKISKDEIIRQEFGEETLWVYKLQAQFNFPNLVPLHFEVGTFYLILGAFIVKNRYKKNLNNMAYALKKYIEETFIVR